MSRIRGGRGLDRCGFLPTTGAQGLFFLILLPLFLLSACSGPEKIMRLSDGSVVGLSDMVMDLRDADVVFVGELHTHKSHHRVQLDIIRALDESDIPLAIGLEMFKADSQSELDRWVSGRMEENDFRSVYMNNWGVDWNQYRDIFLYAREHSLPMIGLNIDESIPRQVARMGFKSLTEEQIKALQGVSCDVDPRYKDFIRRALGRHGGDEMTFRNFCEAQMVRDSTMAFRVMDFIRSNPGYTIVVLAGNAHSWKPGIPEQLKRRSNLSYKVVLPEVQGRIERWNVTEEDADYLWLGLD